MIPRTVRLSPLVLLLFPLILLIGPPPPEQDSTDGASCVSQPQDAAIESRCSPHLGQQKAPIPAAVQALQGAVRHETIGPVVWAESSTRETPILLRPQDRGPPSALPFAAA